MEVLLLVIVLLILISYYITFKFCKSAATDTQELEDKLFLETYGTPKNKEAILTRG